MKKEIDGLVAYIYESDLGRYSNSTINRLNEYDYDYIVIEFCQSASKEALALYKTRLETDQEYAERCKNERCQAIAKELVNRTNLEQAIETIKELKPELLK